MTDLLEIAAPRTMVAVPGGDIEVCGVTMAGVADLFRRFPDIQQMFAGAANDSQAIVTMFPMLTAAVIAAGTGHIGEKKYENAAASLPAGTQVDLFEAILKLTMPQGVVPFVLRLGTALGGDQMSADSLPPELRNLSPAVTPPNASGK